MKLFNFDKIKQMGKRPPAVRTPEEAEARLEEIRSWTRGPFRSAASWFVQVFLIAGPMWIFLRLFNRVKVHEHQRIKQINPPFLFVSNHLTMFDDLYIGALVFLPFAFRSMKYFPWHAPEEQNFFLGPILTWLLKKARCVPLTRGHGLFQPGMRRLEELLQSENIVHIYPEGTRSRTGDINPGKAGVGRLAYRTKAPVVPCYHEGSQDILPIGTHMLKTGKRLAIIIGEPIDMSDLYALPESREVYQKISDRMIAKIRDLREEMHINCLNVKQMPSSSSTVETTP